MKKFISRNVDDTIYIAREFAKSLKGGEAVILEGVLGSGKTVFVKGVAEALGIEDVVTSPSFSIMNIYEGELNLYHFDFYRLEELSEMEELLHDYLYIPDAVVMIEWGYKVKNILKDYIIIRFEIEEEKRIILIDRVII